jgi:hypothetical protein
LTNNAYNKLAGTKYELLIQLQQIEPVLCPATLDVDFAQELTHNLYSLGNG